ncbi:taste receptor type 2 member 8-like [Paroedura picta]|uniref:taste receptor type 2 member 8-like n=1 Tax=Paroedura picta TaxID=143630 RepID=UPI0040569098
MVVMDTNLFSTLGAFFLIVFGIESIVCLLGNGFVLAVSGHSWLCSKKMLACDFLLTALSLSRFLLQWSFLSDQIRYFISSDNFKDSEEHQVSMFFWVYLNTASLWCATWLNVFYCVKVTSFAHPLFSWLKLRIDVLVPRLLGISLLVFIISTIYPARRYFEEEKCHNFTGDLPENTSQGDAHGSNYVIDVHDKCALFQALNILQIYFTAVSFSICLTASVALLLSLWRHTRNLKKGGLSPQDFSTQAHLRVMKPLLLSLFFYILQFAAMIHFLILVFKYNKLEQLISNVFLSSYPSAHSVILIVSNPKLREACSRVLCLRRRAS